MNPAVLEYVLRLRSEHLKRKAQEHAADSDLAIRGAVLGDLADVLLACEAGMRDRNVALAAESDFQSRVRVLRAEATR